MFKLSIIQTFSEVPGQAGLCRALPCRTYCLSRTLGTRCCTNEYLQVYAMQSIMPLPCNGTIRCPLPASEYWYRDGASVNSYRKRSRSRPASIRMLIYHTQVFLPSSIPGGGIIAHAAPTLHADRRLNCPPGSSDGFSFSSASFSPTGRGKLLDNVSYWDCTGGTGPRLPSHRKSCTTEARAQGQPGRGTDLRRQCDPGQRGQGGLPDGMGWVLQIRLWARLSPAGDEHVLG